MTHYNIYNHFIKFGQVATADERQKMVEIIKDWCFVSTKNARIDQKYLNVINQFVTDKKINEIIDLQPNVKPELLKKLFELLENAEMVITERQKDESLRGMFESFIELPNEEFVKFANSNNSNSYKSHLTQNYKKKEVDVVEIKRTVRKFEKDENERIANIENQLVKATKKVKSAEEEIAKVNTEIEAIKAAQAQKPKVVGKIDLNTGKPLPFENPDEKKIEALEDKIVELTIQKEEAESQITELSKNKRRKSISKIRKGFVDNWETQLKLKEILKTIEELDKVRKKFLEELYAKIEELKKLMQLLEPFLIDNGDYGRLWDLSKGNWQSIDFRFLKKYAELLEHQPEIQELAKLLGRYRRAEAEIEQEEFENIEVITNHKIQHSGRSELVGITESDNLNNLLPTEVALFSDYQTENIFFKRFAEKKLQTFKYVSREKSFTNKSVTDKRDKESEKDKGPFIIAVDTSGSMHGEPERLAKIIAFAITKIGIKDKRKIFLISFSTGVKTFELTDIHHSLPKLIDFLQMSFRGGTDASKAVEATIKQMQTENYKKADLLIISDGVFGNLNRNTLSSIKELKENGNRFNALMIGSSYNKRSLDFCNNVWEHRGNNLGKLVEIIKQEINI